jgi:Lrp/AsnC family leucine-responsive transcriptional regulator
MESFELDDIDLRLLDLLQTDASLSNQELAQRALTSPPTCLRRVKRLRDAGLIERRSRCCRPTGSPRCWATA